jgi:hypothetical protein
MASTFIILTVIMQKKVTFLLFVICIATCKLIYGFGMIRHGAKYSFYGFVAPEITNKFKGELAPVGLRQLYNLGTLLRETYVNQ